MNWLLNKILEELKALLHAIGGLFTTAVNAETGLFDAFFKMQDDVAAFRSAILQLGKFDFNPKWRSRVISLPRAWDGIQDLFEILRHGFTGKFQELFHAIETVKNVIEQSAQRQPDEGPSGLANVQEKLTVFKLAVTDFEVAFHAALDISQMALDVKNRLESLDDIFLPSGSAKTVVDVKYRKRNVG